MRLKTIRPRLRYDYGIKPSLALNALKHRKVPQWLCGATGDVQRTVPGSGAIHNLCLKAEHTTMSSRLYTRTHPSITAEQWRP